LGGEFGLFSRVSPYFEVDLGIPGGTSYPGEKRFVISNFYSSVSSKDSWDVSKERSNRISVLVSWKHSKESLEMSMFPLRMIS
jgi:hypothetical protein